jgi:tetratricopeptide (TPR) repeat protein
MNQPAVLGGVIPDKKLVACSLPRVARLWRASKGQKPGLDIGGMGKDRSSAVKTKEKARRLLNQGASLLEQGRAEEAIVHLERANRIDAGNVPTLINLGGAYIMAGRHKEAIPVLEAARNAEPDNAMIWINLGAAYLGNPVLASPEQQMLAIVAFEKALELNPAAPNVHYNLGLVFVDRKENDLAVAAFRQALRVNPFDRDAQTWLHRLGAEEKQP